MVVFKMMGKRLRHTIYRIVILYALLGVFLITTDPRHLPLILLIVPFVLMMSAFYLTISLLMQIFRPSMLRPKRVYFSIVSSGFLTFLLVLNSVNQLTWRDALLLVVLMLFLLFYGSRWQASR